MTAAMQEQGAARPVKPGLPLLMPLALVFWAACAALYSALCTAELQTCAGLVRACLVIGIACAIACAWRALRIRALVLCALALGCAFGSLGAATVKDGASRAVGERGTWQLCLVSDSAASAFGSRASAEASGPQGQRVKMSVSFTDDTMLLQGDVIEVQGAPRAVKEASRGFSWSQGIVCELSASGYEPTEPAGPLAFLRGLRRRAIELFGAQGGEQAGLLQALACGYRPTIEESGAYEAYKQCGLAHLVAVSGAHLAIVAGLLRWTLRRARVPLLAATGACIAFIAAYLVLAGIPISAVRAAIMVVLSLASSFAGRRDSALSALALCIIAFLCTDPPTAVSASFVLSAGSTLGILLFADLIASWFAGVPAKVRELVGKPVGMTLASNVATLPYSMALFSQLPLAAPLANVLAAPLFTIACASSLAGALAACACPAAAALIVPAAAMCCAPLAVCVQALASIPFACVAVALPAPAALAITAAACAALWLIWPRVRAVCAAALAAGGYALAALVIALSPFMRPDQIVMIDVGQGDAFLVQSRGASILIDTGNKDGLLKEGLAQAGVFALDAVVVSHPDDDHCGSLPSLCTYAEVGQVCVAQPLLTCACAHCTGLRATAESCGEPMRGLQTGDALVAGIFTLRVIWPDSFCDEGGNADSLCMLCEADCDQDGISDWAVLFSGDAEAPQLQEMVERGRLGDIDVLKVGHHGSKASLTDALADVLSPEVALISCGQGNRYGHPSAEALACLEDATVLRTDTGGAATLVFRKEGIEARGG